MTNPVLYNKKNSLFNNYAYTLGGLWGDNNLSEPPFWCQKFPFGAVG